MPPSRPSRSGAFAPGRVNLIGEHTDYNRGLALPFAIAEGVTVRAEALPGERIQVHARDLGERDEFALDDRSAAAGWRAFVRGTVAELSRAGLEPVGARIEIGGDLPRGAGLASSAALEVSLCLALLALAGQAEGSLDRIATARLCARVENRWVGAHTGLLDQLASLCGEAQIALCIDFSTLAIEPVPLRLEGWRLVVLDSGERHAHAISAYNQRRHRRRAAGRRPGEHAFVLAEHVARARQAAPATSPPPRCSPRAARARPAARTRACILGGAGCTRRWRARGARRSRARPAASPPGAAERARSRAC